MTGLGTFYGFINFNLNIDVPLPFVKHYTFSDIAIDKPAKVAYPTNIL